MSPQPYRRIRVAQVIARMNVGGPALQVTTLMQGLPTDRYDQRLLTGSVEDDEADYIAMRAPGLPHEVVPGLGRSPRPLDDARALARLISVLRDSKLASIGGGTTEIQKMIISRSLLA